MRTVAMLLLAVLALAGQEQTTQAPAPQQQQPAPAAQPAAPEGPAPEPVAPVAPTGQLPPEGAPLPPPVDTTKAYYGYVDFGWRFRTDIRGNEDAYRSIVNIGRGPTLLSADIGYNPTGNKWLDRLRIIATSWGNYPYSSFRLDAGQTERYRLVFDYRDMDLFSFLPTFANPLLSSGGLTTQYGWDLNIKSFDTELTLFPARRIVPYVAWSRGTDDGGGVRNLVLSRNEYTFPIDYDARADEYRGGLRFGFDRTHFTIEGGYVKYRNDDFIKFPSTFPTPYFGNGASFSGTRLFLSDAYEALGMRGNSPFARGLFTADPFSWLTVSGAFMFSQPESKVNFVRAVRGAVVSGAALAAAELLLTSAHALEPRPSGNFSVEIRPLRWLRITEGFITDRLHVNGTAVDIDTFFTGAGPQPATTDATPGRLMTTFNRNELNAIVDATSHLALRGGYRRVWGNSEVPPSIPAEALNIEQEFATVDQNVGLAGVTYRTANRFRATVDFEGGASNHAYFRTSLYNYQRARAFARYMLTPALELGVRYNALHNNRPRPPYPGPVPRLDYDAFNQEATVSVGWTPESRRYTVLAEYARLTFETKTDWVNPAFPSETILSRYNEYGNTGILLVDMPIVKTGPVTPKISFGGSLYRSHGTRPVQYYAPEAKLWIPFSKRAEFHFDWRWYGFSEPIFVFEGFRVHTFVAALRFNL